MDTNNPHTTMFGSAVRPFAQMLSTTIVATLRDPSHAYLIILIFPLGVLIPVGRFLLLSSCLVLDGTEREFRR